MATILVDDDVSVVPIDPDPDFVPKTIPEILAEGFSPEAEFILCDGEPYVVWPNWDCAEDWSTEPVRAVHPFFPYFHGTKMVEAEFRVLMKSKHGLS